MWKKVTKYNFLIYSYIYTIILGLFKYELNIFKIEFMDWFYYWSINLIYVLSITGIIQLIFKINRVIIKRILLILIIIIFIITSFIFMLIQAYFYNQSYIIKKDGKKMEAIISYEHKNVDIEYYSYINPFMRSMNYIYHEPFPLGYTNPFEGNTEYRQYLKFSITHSLTNCYMEAIAVMGEVIIDL